jgi:chromate transporter
MESSHSPPHSLKDDLLEIFNTYFKLGYTTFGGPAAHIAILYDDIVVKRKWLPNEQFTELFAICQALPGPASTELAYSLALVRSGFLCSIFAFLLWRYLNKISNRR